MGFTQHESIQSENRWYYREGFPKDYDDAIHSTYKRLGHTSEDESFWSTETKRSMETGRGDPQLIAFKKLSKTKKLLSFLNYPITL
ncbi:hypothetical protein Phum_PHUM077630 [Pediculus humanus corporis]|uniref:Uncharacterized protein n=1 Tax=Pediculus humanus subsp. corporis TaxID=121224 RepID=E0VC21_PEDHC|nr:uncharacterized protein Phum_PHUM077630 [Pediculus humanus corporis]EEB10927.1 hypothetical protein Phum_PHUM077630 [Pediculus humanus corporis]